MFLEQCLGADMSRSRSMTGDVTSHQRAFASRNCVISGANVCELVRSCRESVANLRKPVANGCELG
eukprot:3637322-Prymnesium_polylepis.1